MRDIVIKDFFLKAGLDLNETHDAMKAVRRARASKYTWAGKRIEEKSNLSPEQTYDNPFYTNHMLYKALGIYKDATTEQIHSALHKQQALIADLGLQHEKVIQQITRLYALATHVFMSAVMKKAYDRFGDDHLPTNRQLAPRSRLPPPPSTPVQRHQRGDHPVIRPPPQPESSKTPVQRHLREDYIVIRPPPQPESPRTPVQRHQRPPRAPCYGR